MDNHNQIHDVVVEQPTVVKYTKLYLRTVDQFRLRVFLLFLERIYIIISMSIICWQQASGSCEWNSLRYWVLFGGMQAVFSLILYVQVFLLSNSPIVMENLAYHFGQVVVVPIEQAIEGQLAPEVLDPTANLNGHELSKKVDVLAIQMRSEIVNESKIVKFNNYFANATNQLIFIWTVIYIVKQGSETYSSDPCDYWAIVQTYVYGFLLFVQYSHYYLLAAVIIIILPFFSIYMIIKCCKDRKQKNQCQVALRELQKSVIKYKPNCVEGEQECSICMQVYSSDDEVLVLPCSNLHHYHNTCISAWLNVQSTCPNCRKVVFQAPQEEPLLQ